MDFNNGIPAASYKDLIDAYVERGMNEPLTTAQANRVEDMLYRAARNAFRKALNSLKDGFPRVHIASEGFDRAIEGQLKNMADAARLTPKAARKTLREELASKRKKARSDLTAELRKGRQYLKSIHYRITNADKIATVKMREHEIEQRKAIAASLMGAKTSLKRLKAQHKEISRRLQETAFNMDLKSILDAYSPPPDPWIKASKIANDVPAIPGVYFFWSGEEIVYVGRSTNLFKRLKLGSHHRLTERHMISYIPITREKITWAECFYIGVCQPQLNFGKSATHYKEEYD